MVLAEHYKCLRQCAVWQYGQKTLDLVGTLGGTTVVLSGCSAALFHRVQSWASSDPEVQPLAPLTSSLQRPCQSGP